MDDAGTNSVRTEVCSSMSTSTHFQMKDRVFNGITESISASGLRLSPKRVLRENNQIAFTLTIPATVMGISQNVSGYSLGRAVQQHGAGDLRNTAAIIEEHSLKA